MPCKCESHLKLYKKIANWIINDGLALCHKHNVSTRELEKRISPKWLKFIMVLTFDVSEREHLLLQ